MSYPAISLSTATVGRHRCPQKRLQTARQPPVYPNSSPDHRACNSLTPFRCPHAVHSCPSVDSGLAKEAGRGPASISISVYGQIPNLGLIRAFRDAGADRVVVRPHEVNSDDEISAELERIAEVVIR